MAIHKSSNYLHYKGYAGNMEFSETDKVFHGKVIGIKPLGSL
jgi:predicted HicB family RNase H-like nuclease